MKIQIDYDPTNEIQKNFTDENFITQHDNVIEITEAQYNDLKNGRLKFEKINNTWTVTEIN